MTTGVASPDEANIRSGQPSLLHHTLGPSGSTPRDGASHQSSHLGGREEGEETRLEAAIGDAAWQGSMACTTSPNEVVMSYTNPPAVAVNPKNQGAYFMDIINRTIPMTSTVDWK